MILKRAAGTYRFKPGVYKEKAACTCGGKNIKKKDPACFCQRNKFGKAGDKRNLE